MTHIVIDNKKYVLLLEKDYRTLQRTAALKSKSEKTLTLAEARERSKKLIRQWARGQ